jgi:surfactin synthase thioesterase subunit
METRVVDLLCLPWAGASANVYLRWRTKFPRWIRVSPLELPGRGTRLAEPLMEDFEQLVDALCAVHAAAMHGRYAFFGHSMGALLAFAMAHAKQRHGGTLPCALIVSGSPAPARRDPRRTAARNDAALLADLRTKGGTPEEVFANEELLRMALDTLRADYNICDSFRAQPREPLSIPLHVLAGASDDVTSEQLAAWRHASTGPFTQQTFEGGHFFVRSNEERVVTAMARALEPLRPSASAAASVR